MEPIAWGQLDSLRDALPGIIQWNQMTDRQRRKLVGTLASLRHDFGIKNRERHAEGYYRRLLAVWDAREGWTGQGYGGKRMALLAACRAAAACKEDYYAAFRLIIGGPYSSAAWKVHIGAIHSTTPKADSLVNRRNAGRPRGASDVKPRGASQGGRTSSLPAGLAAAARDPAEEMQASEIEKLLDLLRQGVTIELAIGQVEELSEDARRLLSDPANRSALDAFIRSGCPTS